MSSSWIDDLASRGPLSAELVAWARTQPDLQTAWASCERLDWMLELGVALAVDDTTQRALVLAARPLILDDPWFLRLVPPGFTIAAVWAAKGDVDDIDRFGLRRFDDFKNACVIFVPAVAAAMLLLQYHFHVSRSVLQGVRFCALPALYAFAQAWGRARILLAKRALRNYRFERVEHDVLRPARWLARKAPPTLQKAMAVRFRKGWNRVAEFPAATVSAASG